MSMLLSSPPSSAFISGIAWAVIVGVSHALGQAESLQQYHIGRLMTVIIGSIPTYLIDRAGLSLWISLTGLFSALIVWILCKHQLSPETNSLTVR